ncbi:hypothetical protein MAQ5080_01484 [Marinomonas aquimarina]|uniref:Inositolphosphotransferase Aur1/Ipt1 domain-containing protein n=1 Tax=Marinomonas aquimarina TaxID=295068 RepID=A0A1A8TAV2_9GAMM|nr:phosphatase PAP2 family protein [Marinomonas aquimarina]SBS29727.1 hypothetical protein MAQ5080_01484 [Marinomonas aquimarina]
MTVLNTAPFQRDRYIYATCFMVIVLHFVAHQILGTPFLSSFYILFTFKAFAMTCLLGFVVYFFVLLYRREKSPLSQYAKFISYPFKHPSEALNIALMLTAISLILSVYTSVKDAISFINPFYLDPLLISLEEKIHFGYQPWQLTHALFNSSLATGVINLFYNLWFFFCWIFIIYFCVATRNAQLRQQALISFIGCWMLIGGVLAILFSSVGPCFYGNAYDQSPLFDPLMTLLNAQHNELLEQDMYIAVWALKTQDLLWSSHIANASTFGEGISAMPSMHVSMATLMALSLSALNKKLGVLGWLYLVMIQIGSVHLGWHYALDGYVSIPLTIAIWYAVKKLVPSPNAIREKQPRMRPYA